ncbi:hypothetical protein C8J56DRAFT_1005856 [Mycena floridula]|nr:hypothetical protein C8J56DRAFT_1005856 [Mycena floridula]
MPVPKAVQNFFSLFPLKYHPAIEHKRPALTGPILWIWSPSDGLLSSDVECLKWQAYIAFRGLTNIQVRHDIDAQGAIDGRLPNLQVPLTDSAKAAVPATVKISDGDSELFPAAYIPAWADLKLNHSLDPLEGYRDEAARDESRAWISLLEGNVHAALISAEPSASIVMTLFSFEGVTSKSQQLVSILTPPLPSSTGLTSLMMPLWGTRISSEAIHSRYQEAVGALSDRLGNNKWFLGSQAATALDALLFAYIHCLLKSTAAKEVTQRVNLVAWERRIRSIVNEAFIDSRNL